MSPAKVSKASTKRQATGNGTPMHAPATATPAKPAPKPRFGTGSAFKGKAGRSGPAKGNSNALRHGLKCGKLPADAKYVENRLNAFRRTLEAAVIDNKGEVNLQDAASIQTCIRWERHACLAQRWLNKMQDELKPEQRLNFSREIARASAERDKAIAALQLGAKVAAPWLALPDESEHTSNGNGEQA